MMPTLHTKRLTLRAHTMADFPAYEAFFASDRAQYMGGPLAKPAAWAQFSKDVAQWALLGHGALAVDLKDTGEFVGQVGINGYPGFSDAELGWLVLPNGEARGIAFEAAQEIRNWAFGERGLNTLVSYIHTENQRSIALAERLGASLDKTGQPCPYDHHVTYRHPAPGALQ
ncbi:MAG: GNAT family N-acetyltransferase [Paracoccaceae bacterium]